MIKIENFKHNLTSELENHIEFGIKYEHKKLVSVSTRNTFWSLSIYNKESTIVWEV